MASSNSQITKPQCGCFKRAEPPDVNINTGVQSINTERASEGSFRPVVKCIIYSTVKGRMYQCKVDVDMLNAVKSLLADVSSVTSPSSEL